MIDYKNLRYCIKRALLGIAEGKSKRKLLLLIATLIAQTVSLLIIFVTLAIELSALLSSVGLYSSAITAAEFLYLVIAVIYVPQKLRQLRFANKEATDKQPIEATVADYVLLYCCCLLLYLCTVMPTTLMFLRHSFSIGKAITELLLVVFVPLLPCSVSALLLRFFNGKHGKNIAVKLANAFVGIVLYLSFIYIALASAYDKLALFLIKIAPCIQTVFFHIGYAIRALEGNSVEVVPLAIISVAAITISFTIVSSRNNVKKPR